MIGPLPTPEVLRYSAEIADALDHAHRRGLVHRDLKPGNVMLTGTGVKLLDFGLSKLQPSPSVPALATASPHDVPLTADGALLGTFPYMAPEQLEGREVDVRSDIFAFGSVVYEMRPGGGPSKGRRPRPCSARSSTLILHQFPRSNRSRRPSWTVLSRAAWPKIPRIVGRLRAT